MIDPITTTIYESLFWGFIWGAIYGFNKKIMAVICILAFILMATIGIVYGPIEALLINTWNVYNWIAMIITTGVLCQLGKFYMEGIISILKK